MSLAPPRDGAPTGGPTYDLFVSYAETDRSWVEGYLFDALDAAGVTYVSEAAFELGAPRVAEFERAVRASRRTLLVITPAYLADAYAPFGDLLAQTFGVETGTWPVIPLTLEDTPLPPRLAMLVAVDATRRDSWGGAVEKLCAAINRPVPAESPVPCPYPGMLPFREDDANRFFGRDAEVAEMVERLRLHRFLAVIGPSGTGKSSLVLAGLLPALRSSGLFGTGDWQFVVLRPGPAPLAALDLALAGGDGSARRVLVCDQFEETFTIGHEQAGAFQQRLAQFAQADRCWVVVTARADFYADLMSSPLWTEIRSHRVEVAPLGDPGLRAAIIRPAEAVGVCVDPALVDRLVADAAGEPGVLPLVQEALVLSWEGLARRYLPVEAYQSIAGGDHRAAARSGLQIALARRADATLAQLPPERQTIARRVFVRLVQFGEGRADTRRQQRVVDLRSAGDDPAELDATVTHLVDHRLLTSTGGEDAADRRIDLAHEALITGWPTLQGWLTERREAEQTRRRLDGKAEEWLRLGRGRGGLLDEIELAETERWLDGSDAADLGFDPALADLAVASRAAADQARSSRRRRVRALVGSLALGLLIVAGLAVWGALSARSAREGEQRAREAEAVAEDQQAEAERQRAEADEQRAEAEAQARIAGSRQLAANAASQMDRRLDRAMLLAVQAYRTEPTLQARSILLAAVGHSPRALRFLDAGPAEVRAVAFGPDDLLVAVDDEGALRRWDVESGAPVGQPGQLVRDAAAPEIVFSADGRMVAFSSFPAEGSPPEVHLWDVESETELGDPISAPGERLDALAVSPDGRLLAIGLDDSVIQLWDIEAGRWFGEPMPARVWALEFSPDGRVLASGVASDGPDSDESVVSLWDVATQQLIVETPVTNDGGVNAIDFTPDGAALAAGHGGGKVEVLSSIDLTPLGEPFVAPSGVWDVEFNAQGTVLATTSFTDDHILLWTPDDPVPEKLAGHAGEVESLHFSADGTRLVSGSADGRLILWGTGTEHALHRAGGQAHAEWVSAVAFDGDAIVSVDGSSSINRWDPAAQPLGQPTTGAGDVVATLSADGRIAATGDDGGVITLVNTSTGEAIGAPIAAHGGLVTALSFSGDGRTLASLGCVDPDDVSCVDAELAVWEVETGRRLGGGPLGDVAGLALSPDGMTAALSTRFPDEVLLWDVAADEQLPDPLVIGHDIGGLAWSSDSRLLVVQGWFLGEGDASASVRDENDVVVWDVASRTPVGEPLLGHPDGVVAAAFSPDGKVLASGDFSGGIRLWDVDTLSPLGGSIDTGSWVRALRFNDDGTALASGHGDGQVWLWEMTPESWIDRLCATAGRDLSEGEWAEFVGDVPYETTCSQGGG